MKKRPLSIWYLTFLYVGIAFSFPVQIIALYNHEITEVKLILSKISFMNWVVIVGSLICAFLIHKGSKWALGLLSIQLLIVTLNNLIVGTVAFDYSMTQTVFATIGLSAATFGVLVFKGARTVLLYGEGERWNQAPRKQFTTPVRMMTSQGVYLSGQTYDVSETGIFVPYIDDSEGLMPNSLDLGDEIGIHFKLDGHDFTCKGRVVRKGSSGGMKAEGLGIRFTDMNSNQKRSLRSHILEI